MIHTRIAKILSPTKVVLPVGAEHGVLEGTEFIIYELGEEIHDPETGESLGRLELHKGRVRVSQIQDKLCVATTHSRVVERQTLPPVWSGMLFSDLLSRTYKETVYDK